MGKKVDDWGNEITEHQMACTEAMHRWSNCHASEKERLSLYARYIDIRDGLPIGTTAKRANKSRIYYCRLDELIDLN